MKVRTWSLVTLLAFVLVLGSTALALAPMGPSTAELQQGQLKVGFDYSYSDMDLEASAFGISGTEKGFKSNMFAANLGIGAADWWEAYIRLGAADVDLDDADFNGGYGFLVGFGTKVTWARQETVSWGAMYQMQWIDSEEDYPGIGSLEVNYYEIQIAVGPTWQANESLKVYGGPFLHFVDGEADADIDILGISLSADLEQESEFGGYIGAQLDIAPAAGEVTDGAYLFTEGQYTADAWGVGTGVGWKF